MSRDVFTLSDSYRLGQVISVSCGSCRRKHYYDPQDLVHLMGDQPLHNVRHKMVCDQCRTGEYLRTDTVGANAAERQSIRLRRLKRIKWVPRVEWVDE